MSAAVAKASILVVEEDPALRAVYRAALKGAGYGVIAVGDGLDALRVIEQLESERSAATFEAARRLRQHPQLRSTPVIVYATWLSAEHIEIAARSGLLWLQITPIDKLVAAIRGLLSATERAG